MAFPFFSYTLSSLDGIIHMGNRRCLVYITGKINIHFLRNLVVGKTHIPAHSILTQRTLGPLALVRAKECF